MPTKREEYRVELDSLFKLVMTLDPADPLLAEFAKYLCVRVAGFAEVAVSELCEEYASGFSGSDFLTTYVWNTARAATNPDGRKLKVLFGHFDTQWGGRVESHFLREASEREAWKTVMLNRNKVAHGEASNISSEQLKDYLKHIDRTLDWLEKRLACDFKA